MTFFLPKNFSSQSLKKSILIYCKLFDKFISKVKCRPKELYSGNLKIISYINIKTIFGLLLPFAISFMFELKFLSFKKKFDMTLGLI